MDFQQTGWFFSFYIFDKGGNSYTAAIEDFGPDFYICRKSFSRKFWYFKVYWEKLQQTSTEYLKTRSALVLPTVDELFILGFSFIFYYSFSLLLIKHFSHNNINYRYFQYYYKRPQTFRRVAKRKKYELHKKLCNYALCQYFLIPKKKITILKHLNTIIFLPLKKK